MSRTREMDAKRQCYWWWFDSHKSARSSPWLQSTLSELNEKTKAMLKLVDEDADSFAQRAEMYYKKRPDLISMVEDFYRAHRSLAERYDQLRFHHTAHARSPLRYSFPLPKSEYDNNVPINSIKCFDSFTEVGYNSEESEIDNLGDVDFHLDLDEPGTKNLLPVGSIHDELMKLKDELEQIREENEFQRNIIEQKARENEELMKQTSDLMKLKEERERLKMQNINTKEELRKKGVETMAAKRQLQEVMYESRKLREELLSENRLLKEMAVEKDEGKREVIRQLSSAMEMVREENLLLRKLVMKESPKKQTSPDFQIFKNINWRQLFNLPSKRQTGSSVVPLEM